MKYSQIFTSLLANDLYKFSMGQAIYHQFPDYMTTWNFKCRNTDVVFTHEMIEEIRDQIREYCNLRFNEYELSYLQSIPWMKSSYINFLRLWKPRFEDFTIEETDSGCHLRIRTNGTWLNTSMYEIPILAIVNEVYFRTQYNYKELMDEFKKRADQKVQDLIDGKFRLAAFSEFGLRRRLSGEAQEYIVKKLIEANPKMRDSVFVGTSNVYLAMELGTKAVGTMAHEFIMCVGQGNHKHNPAYSNHYMMEAWVKEYKTQNGTALTDAITTDAFLRDFDLTYATLFSGVRHDSGDPLEWGEKMIAHYKKLGIDPKTKTLLFSDSLDLERATKIHDYFDGRAKVAFGIGTFLANDTNVPALNIVCKTVKCNGMDVAKLSDVEGKGMCENQEYVDYLRRTIDWRLKNSNE